jgi:hypothetical protein
MGTGRRHPRREVPATLRLHVRVEGAFPPVWRRIEVASDLGLDDLHDVLQVVFGWKDRHLYRFTTGPEHEPGAAFACTADLREAWDDDPTLPTWDVRVDELLAEAGERLSYQYDYGDNWWLAIEVEDVVDGHVQPDRATLLEGAGAGPPEDCGGVHGYRMLVAAADPAHPDHDAARAEAASWWGDAIDPANLGIVPFDPAAIAQDLRRLDLPHRLPVPRHISEKLVALLLRSRTTAAERQLRRLASSADGECVIDHGTQARMVDPLRVVLDVVGDGVKLTAAGYLPPAVVRTIFDQLDLAEEWVGKGNREDLTTPVLELREAAQRLGLLRKNKGRLVPTARGRTLGDDPVGLWWHLAGRLPIGGRDVNDASWQAGVLLLALMASGSTRQADMVIAQLLTGLGWEHEGGQPVDRRTVLGLLAENARLLRRVGALDDDWQACWPGEITVEGLALARAALVAHHP